MNRNFAINFAFDAPVDAVRDFRRLGRAQKRHDDIVHATKKRESRRHDIERCPEDSVYFHYPYRDEALRRLTQPGRWTKYVGGNAAGYIKYYPGLDIEKANAAEKALRRAEKLDEEIADKADVVMNQYWDSVADEADYLLDEFEYERIMEYNAIVGAAKLEKKWVVVDANHPGILFHSETAKNAMMFSEFIDYNGGDAIVCKGENVNTFELLYTFCNVDKEWNGDMEASPFRFWYYREGDVDYTPFQQTRVWRFNL